MHIAKLLLKYAVGLLIIGWLLAQVDFRKSLDLIQWEQWHYYAAAFLCFGVSRLFEGVRFYCLVPGQKLSAWLTLRVVAISTFFNNFAATVVGDGFRTYAVNQVIDAWVKSVTVVFLDRLVGLVVLLATVGLCTLVLSDAWLGLLQDGPELKVNQWAWLISGCVGFLLVGLWLVLRLGLLTRIIDSVKQALSVLTDINTGSWLTIVVATISAQLMLALMIYVLLASFAQPVTFVQTLFSMLVVFLAAYVPISIGALGVREGVLVVLLAFFGATQEAALAAALLSRLMMYIYAGAGGLWLVFERHGSKQQRALPQ